MRALICGVNGQDGSYLAQLLLSKGYEVWGSSRDIQGSSLLNLKTLFIDKKLHLISMAPNDFRSAFTAVEKSDPDEIYYLSGQSSVGLSFEQPVETLDSIVSGVLNLLEIMRLRKKSSRFYNASSSECFGENGNLPANELTPFRPRSPYAVAKASAHWMVINYRESYQLFACNGILFNHESPLRHSRFVTQKIVSAACRIADGSKEKLQLGRLDIVRDWGWAPEYVDAMWRMLQSDRPDDYVIATGEANSLERFVQLTFDHFDLDWRKFVFTSNSLLRPADLAWSQGDPSRASKELNWVAQKKMKDVIEGMIYSVAKTEDQGHVNATSI